MDQLALPIGTIIDDLEIKQVLSVGAYGQVYLAKDIYTLEEYAVKSLPRPGPDSHQLSFQQTEIMIHTHLSGHPHIIPLEKVIKTSKTSKWIHAVIEYGPEGDLFTAIIDRGIYYGNHSLIRHVFLQLIDAVRYCHSKGIYHRDLKPENILVFDQGRTLKLADFGLATTDRYSTDYGCGSTFYFSPECQGGLLMNSWMGYATAPNDVWSLGIILINLAAGRNPWRIASLEDETYSAFLQDPNLLLKILPISNELNRILKRIFCLDPLKRITLDELYLRVQHCTHFTRTPEVSQYENMVTRRKTAKLAKIQIHSKVVTDLPSPPDTPKMARSVSSSTDQGSTLLTGTDLSRSDVLFSKNSNHDLESHYPPLSV
ncbi:Pkinase-domain-containing protein [Rhizopus microsporus ATCC 52813]|uniref:Pkinase-domain-containing protein n=1 Tax=Rhizopus microsporus ATCC 52813 TaxID=1340429 RepID=A0A2G4SKW0_RHIZD|nr:Pkinase-domain-containing protein [Rhizopus microsporus ATCC 52813]PHZ09410.1 Pkinase-domain-containing protein [Rhizopus microsporus ATCC 52813]